MKKNLKIFKKNKVEQIINNSNNNFIIILRYTNLFKTNVIFLKKLSIKYNFSFYKLKHHFLKISLNQGNILIIYFNKFNFNLIKNFNEFSFFDLILLRINNLVFSKNKLNQCLYNKKDKQGLINFLNYNYLFLYSYKKLYKIYLIKILLLFKLNNSSLSLI